MRRWQKWYPKSWRARYGEEYEQLLEDLDAEHRLSGRDQLDVYRSGIVLHGASPDGRRRILVVTMAVAIIGAGLGLGLGLGTGGSTANGTFVAPALPVSAGQLASATGSFQEVGCSGPANLDGQLLGPNGVPVEDSYYWESPAMPPNQELSSGSIGAISWSIYAAKLSPTHASLLSRLESGGIGVDGHWYSLCNLFRQSIDAFNAPLFANRTSPAPSFTVVDIRGEAVVIGVVPTPTTGFEVTADGGAPVHPRVIEPGVGPFSIVFGVLAPKACRITSITASDITSQRAWQDAEPLVPSRCAAFQPLLQPQIGGGIELSRNVGTVISTGAGSLVVSTADWPPLHVSASIGVDVLVRGPTSPDWVKGSLSEIERCDTVYVAGTISPKTAVASEVYILSTLPTPACAR